MKTMFAKHVLPQRNNYSNDIKCDAVYSKN